MLLLLTGATGDVIALEGTKNGPGFAADAGEDEADADESTAEGTMKVFPLENGAYTASANPKLDADNVADDGHSMPVDESGEGAEINTLHREIAEALKEKMPDLYVTRNT